MTHHFTIFIGSEAQSIRLQEDHAMQEIGAWAEFERRSADAVAEMRASYGEGDSCYFPEEFYVRQIVGLDPETGQPKMIVYRFHDLTNIVTVREASA